MSVGPHSAFGPLANSTLRSVDALSDDVIWNQMFLSHQWLKSLNQDKTVVFLSGSPARTGHRTSVSPGPVPAEIRRRQQQEAVRKPSAVSEVWSPTATRSTDRLRLLLLLLQVLKLELKEIREEQDLLFRFMNFLKQEGAVHMLQFCLTVGKNTLQSLA